MPRYDGTPTRAEKKAARRSTSRDTSHMGTSVRVPSGWFEVKGETLMVSTIGKRVFLEHVDGGEREFATREAAYAAALAGRGPRPTYDL